MLGHREAQIHAMALGDQLLDGGALGFSSSTADTFDGGNGDPFRLGVGKKFATSWVALCAVVKGHEGDDPRNSSPAWARPPPRNANLMADMSLAV